MPYYLGVDAGGTKTAFLLTDERGQKRGACRLNGCRLLSRTAAELTELLRQGAGEVCRQAAISERDIAFSGVGISGYGEAEGSEAKALNACEKALGTGKVVCACDCHVAWAGSLALQPGVNVISGTGAISYGVNAEGRTARSSGWGALFDEGSCQWIGVRLVQAYTWQADGRLPVTALYARFRERFGITDDSAFIHRLNTGFFDDAARTASLQTFCLELYQEGDPCAAGLYARAAHELARAVKAVARQLGLREGYRVSYSGGLFEAGSAILEPFQKEITALNAALTAPRCSPVEGAILMAMQAHQPGFAPDALLF